MHLESLLAALRDPRCYPHACGRVELVETHISWVLLAGDYAYKFKKPVNFGFVDFSSLALRHRFCEEELRLNRRLAPDLYLDVVAVTGSIAEPRIGGNGTPIEFAVRMRRFDRRNELDALAARGELLPAHIDELAATVARFHRHAPVAAAESRWGLAEGVLAPCLDNFAQVRACAGDAVDLECVAHLEAWTLAEHARLARTITARRDAGFVRECHGDLHLRNMVLIDDHVVVFDAIEFNAGLRWIDVIAEVAFTVMDLRHRGRIDLAQRFINAWLEHSGDYAGLALLPFHIVYRAMVRAKVAGLRSAQATDPAQRARLLDDLRAHLALARSCSAPHAPCLLATCGVSGSGKSHLAARLAQTDDWIRLRSDVERKRLAGLAASARSDSALASGLYGPATTRDTYARLAELAGTVLDAGFPVIVDATFLRRAQREAIRKIAEDRRVPFALVAVHAPAAVLRTRIAQRAVAGADPSEATVEVLEHQLAQFEPPDDQERALTVAVDTTAAVDISALNAAIAAAARITWTDGRSQEGGRPSCP